MLKKTRDLARSLVAREAKSDTSLLQTELASVRVYERLRRQLGAPVGTEAFQTLATRALALARSESPRLNAVQIMANGGMRGLGDGESQTNSDENEAGIILIAQLLGLFLTFLGEPTTLRLIEDLRLQSGIEVDPLATSEATAEVTSEDRALAVAFEDLLQEIGQLRKVSGRIEDLVGKHPEMEEGLLSAAGSIRNIATVLDVFTLVRSKAGGPQEDGPNPKANRYLN